MIMIMIISLRLQEKPEQHFAKLQFKSDYYMLNRLDRDTGVFC